MPQKRNPDAAELARGKAGRIFGALQTLLVVIKGLPLAYGKDMQEDKEPVFDAADSLSLMIAATAGMIGNMTIAPARMEAALTDGFPTATDLADWIVRVLGKPFREAHHITGSLVAMAEGRNLALHQLTIEDMQSVEPAINDDIFSVLTVASSVKSRTSLGGTAPANVRKQAKKWQTRLAREAAKRK